MKNFVLIALLLPCFTTLAADLNPYKSSYGKWLVAGSDEPVLSISAKGMDKFANVPAKCKQKSKGYIHKAYTVSGKSILATIKQGIQNADDDSYKKDMKQVIPLIDKNKKYFRIDVVLSCGDGMESFIQINEKVGLYAMIAPEEYYSIAIKK